MLVGSKALIDAGYNLNRNPMDIDLILSWKDFKSLQRESPSIKACYPLNDSKWVIKHLDGVIVECEIAWEGSTGESLINLCEANSLRVLDVVYTLKMSHRYLKDSPHFLKTMQDIKLLRSYGAKIPYCLVDWLVVREKETYNYKHPVLNMAKTDFFNTEGVVYTYDHDSIHEAVKLLGNPAYTYFKPEDKQVWCSKEMFFECKEEIRLAAVFEESCVLAIERSLVPFNDWGKEEWAFKRALEKVCTSITSGWFREYAWENYEKVLEMKEFLGKDFLKKKFDLGLTNNLIIKTK